MTARQHFAYRTRLANAGDVDVIAHHRAGMFRDMGLLNDQDTPAVVAATRTYLITAIPAGVYLGWVVESDGEVVAGGGVIVRPLLPRPGHLAGGDEAYVLNVYTEPAHRRRGLARELMRAILDWCRERGITRVSLHASDDGRPLYEHLGFKPTNEMRLGE